MQMLCLFRPCVLLLARYSHRRTLLRRLSLRR